MSWSDDFNVTGTSGVSHTVRYALNGDRLERSFDSDTHTVARGVASAAFSLDSAMLTAQVEVIGDQDGTRTLSVNALMRAHD